MELTPGRVNTLDARKGVLVEKHLAGDDEGTGGRHIDARLRRVLRWSEADPKPIDISFQVDPRRDPRQIEIKKMEPQMTSSAKRQPKLQHEREPILGMMP